MQNQNNNYEGALSWDSTIEKESSFVLLEPGEYNYKVTNMTRGQYTPGPNAKITEACPMAELELEVTDSIGQTATVKENLILHTSLEWKISQFFISIGQKIKGQPFVPNWAQVVGATGRGEFDTRKYTSKGEEREANQVKNFLEPVAGQPVQQQPQQTQPVQQQAQQQTQPQTQPQGQQATTQPNTQPQTNPGFDF